MAESTEHFSDRDTLFGRITYNGETTINPNGFPSVCIDPATGNIASTSGTCSALPIVPVVTSYAGPNNEDQYGFGLSYVHVYNPNLLLNLKFGVFRGQILSFPANQATFVSNKLGFPCNTTSCINYSPASSLVGSSALVHWAPKDLNSGTTFTTIGDTTFVPLGYWDTNFVYSGTLTWNHGPHSVRVGLALNPAPCRSRAEQQLHRANSVSMARIPAYPWVTLWKVWPALNNGTMHLFRTVSAHGSRACMRRTTGAQSHGSL